MQVRNGNKFGINLLLCVQLRKVSFLTNNGWKSVVLVARLLDASVHMNTMFSQFCSREPLIMCSALGSARGITSMQYCKTYLPSLPTCYFFVLSYSSINSHDIRMVASLNFSTYRKKMRELFSSKSFVPNYSWTLVSTKQSQRHH